MICFKAELLITGLAAEMLDFRSDETQAEGTAPNWKRLWILGWPLLVWTFLVGSLFWPFITAQQLIGYRDGFQFYWPMFKWADAVWASGEWPLWCPYDGLGRSHLAEGVSSLFYPGKLVFFARWLSFESRYGIYLALHVWLAGLGASWCAGRIGADRTGKLIAMLSYGLAGPVLFAANNVIYLVSAAWLPWGLGAIWNWRQPRQRGTSICGVSMCAALMILGGDPQMAVNLLLITGACWLAWSGCSELPGGRIWRLGTVATHWGLAVFATICLALVQLLPTAEASRASERAAFVEPRSLIEWVTKSWNQGEPQSLASIWGEPEAGTHAADVYEFSQPPWTIGEWIWPGFSGRPYPIWTHWSSSLPGAGRMWQPSLYQGLFPLALALSVVWRRELRWLVWIGAVAGLGALGWYGPVWLVNEIGLATGWWEPVAGVNRATGGVYWFLTNVVPGYLLFRYPAKLMVLVSLVLALLAGWGWSQRVPQRVQRVLLGLAGLTVALLLLSLVLPWDRIGRIVVGDELFGPFDVSRFRRELWRGGVQILVIALLGWMLLTFRIGRWRWLEGAWLVVAFLAFDLLLANSWMLPGLPDSKFEFGSTPPIEAGPYWVESASHTFDWESLEWFSGEFPESFRSQSSGNRLEELAAEAGSQGMPRLHWLQECRYLNAPSTIEPFGWQDFIDDLNRDLPRAFGDTFTEFDCNKVFLVSDPTQDSMKHWAHWWVDFAPPGEKKPAQFLVRRLTATVSVESTQGKVIWRNSQKLIVKIKLASPGTILLTEAYAPGWRVDGINLSDGSQVGGECVPVAEWLRGFWLPAGDYQLEFSYTPPSLYLSICTSLIGWFYGIVFLILRAIKH